jgi:hypothetical protein
MTPKVRDVVLELGEESSQKVSRKLSS